MLTEVKMPLGGGAVCVHCGKVRINQGDPCILVNTGKGIGYIALSCKEGHPWTKGHVIPKAPEPPVAPAKK